MAKFCGAVKRCVVCDVEFKVPACRAATAICCSRKCKDKWWSAQRNKTVQLVCKGCGTEFAEYASHVERRAFCSRACKAKYEVRPDHSGNKNPCWKGGKSPHQDGYIYVLVGEHPFASTGNYIFEHRYVMEQWLIENDPESRFLVEIEGEKYLSPEIVIHHKNQLKTDNRIGNLECMTQSEHMTHHHNDPDTIRKYIANLQNRLANLEKD